MPFIITTTIPNGSFHGEITNCAVATIEEARDRIEPLIRAQWGYFGKSLKSPPDHLLNCHEMPETGGTIGPLPDGTTITVELVD